MFCFFMQFLNFANFFIISDLVLIFSAMSVAHQSLYETIKDTYEQDWPGYTRIYQAVEVGNRQIKRKMFLTLCVLCKYPMLFVDYSLLQVMMINTISNEETFLLRFSGDSIKILKKSFLCTRCVVMVAAITSLYIQMYNSRSRCLGISQKSLNKCFLDSVTNIPTINDSIIISIIYPRHYYHLNYISSSLLSSQLYILVMHLVGYIIKLKYGDYQSTIDLEII